MMIAMGTIMPLPNEGAAGASSFASNSRPSHTGITLFAVQIGRWWAAEVGIDAVSGIGLVSNQYEPDAQAKHHKSKRQKEQGRQAEE